MRNINNMRCKEITDKYFLFLDNHLNSIIAGDCQEFLTLKKTSVEIAVSHKNLIDIVKTYTGKSPSYFYKNKIIAKAIKMLTEQNMKPATVAKKLNYDPSNFSKVFKKFTGKSPGQYKNLNL